MSSHTTVAVPARQLVEQLPATAPALSALTPHVLQQGALDALGENLAAGGRGVVVMPCGAGKTLLGPWYAELIRARLVVVFVPTLALVSQTLAAYRAERSWPHEAMIVCSDETTGRAASVSERGLPPGARRWVTVSTSPRQVQQFLAGTAGARLVVSTYQSAPRVATALRRGRLVADLVVCDEAHRLAGRPRHEFRSVLDDGKLPAQRRVFLTATPVAMPMDPLDEYAVGTPTLSMDDERTFGPVVYRATFGQAVAAGCLVDYEVEVVSASAGDGRDGQPVSTVDAVLAAAKTGARRILTFHTRVASAAATARALDGQRAGAGRIRAEHLDHRHRARDRAQALARLADPPEGEVAVLSSARVLTEGIDVPAVDCVVLGEPRTSTVDVIQAVGRAMRTAPGKSRGRVILPVTLEDEADHDTALATSRWRHVWLALHAIASMDGRFAAVLDRARGRHFRGNAAAQPALQLRLPDGITARLLRTVDRDGRGWMQYLNALASWAAHTGHARPGRAVVHDGLPIGIWTARQCRRHRDKTLGAAQVARLEALPGWAWNDWEHDWWEAATLWRSAHADHQLGGDEPNRWLRLARRPGHPGRPRGRRGYHSLAEFALDTDRRRQRGELPVRLADAVEDLPQWQWQLLRNDDAIMLDALAEYAAWKGTCNPPSDYQHDDLPLGPWTVAVRRRRCTGRLDPLLAVGLASVRRATGATPFRWQENDTKWRLCYVALRQFVRREGHCRIPDGHIEPLPDTDVELYDWARRQRRARRRKQLPPAQAALLDQVPGWQWEIQLQHYRPGPDAQHGTRTEYARGCRCSPCLHANPSRRTRTLADAEPARQHLAHLRALGVSQASIAKAAGVNQKTIAAVEHGTYRRLHPDILNTILALTAEHAWQAQTESGSGLVNSSPARDHIHTLLRHRGITQQAIARATGLSNNTISSITTGSCGPHLHATTAQAILALTPETARTAQAEHGRQADISPVRDHLLSLRAQGATLEAIATASGTSIATIYTLTAHNTQRCFVLADTARAILATSLADVRAIPTPSPYVDAQPTRNHINNLRAHGVTQRAIAQAAGIGLRMIGEIERGTRPRLQPAKANAILNITLTDILAPTHDP